MVALLLVKFAGTRFGADEELSRRCKTIVVPRSKSLFGNAKGELHAGQLRIWAGSLSPCSPLRISTAPLTLMIRPFSSGKDIVSRSLGVTPPPTHNPRLNRMPPQ